MESYTDQQIIESWKKNVQPWIAAIREGEIENRLLVTNQAVWMQFFRERLKQF